MLLGVGNAEALAAMSGSRGLKFRAHQSTEALWGKDFDQSAPGEKVPDELEKAAAPWHRASALSLKAAKQPPSGLSQHRTSVGERNGGLMPSVGQARLVPDDTCDQLHAHSEIERVRSELPRLTHGGAQPGPTAAGLVALRKAGRASRRPTYARIAG